MRNPRRCIQDWKMHWAVNERRKDKRTGAVSPVKGGKYFEELSRKGAGWNAKTN